MNKEKRRVPKLRFPGFTEDWEQRKLGDFYTFKNGLNKEKVYFGYGDSIVNFTDVFHNRQIYSSTLKGKVCVNKKELENYKVKEGDLFFTRTSETIEEIGFPAVVMEPMERVVFSGFVLRGRAEKYDPLVNIFKSYIFFTDNFRSEMKKKSSMTTRALTSGTALKEMYFSYPRDLEEQNKIGEILLRLDKIITLHQRKLKHLNFKKKALLQKLFPKNGERHPELRFPEFTDAWEQRKLGDIATFSKGNGYSKSDLTPSGDPIILYGRLYTNYETTISNVDTFVELKDKSVISQGGEVIVPASGETAEDISRASVVKNQGIIIGGDLNVIKVNHLLDPTFLALTISNGEQQKELSKRAQGKSVVHLHNSDLQEVNLTFPLLNEQKEISTLFEKMDNIITLHQRKLEHLQLQKKALLQQMFV